MALDTRSAAGIVARLDRIPVWPHKRTLLWLIGIGYFFGFVDVVNIGYALPVISQQFHVSSEAAAGTITSGLVGYILGAYVDGTISDLRGRKVSLMLSVAVFTLGSLLATFSPNLTWLITARFITGLGIGAEIASVTTYIGEVAPAGMRGRYTGLATTFAYAGFSAVPFIALVLVPHFTWGWRALMFFGAIGGLTITVLRRDIPESPRWLLSKGHVAEADRVVVECEAIARERYGHDLPAPAIEGHEAVVRGFPTRSLFKAPFLGRLILLVLIWFFYYIANYGWLTLAPTLLVDHGYTLTNSISYLVVSSLGFFFGALGSSWVGDKFERKWFISAITTVFALALLILGLFPSPVIIMVCGIIASITIGLMVPLLYALTAEHFPTPSRTTGVALTDGLGHLGGAFVPAFVLGAYSVWGFSTAFFVMAIAAGITAVLLPFGIRATRRSLVMVASDARDDQKVAP